MPPKQKKAKRLATKDKTPRPQRKTKAPTRLVEEAIQESTSGSPMEVLPQDGQGPVMTDPVIETTPTEEPSTTDLIQSVVKEQMKTLEETLAASMNGMVETAVAKVVANFGPTMAHNVEAQGQGVVETAGSSGASAPTVLMSTSHDALQTAIPARIKDKIWADEYIDLATLLDPDCVPEYQLAMSRNTQGEEVIGVVPKNPKVINTIVQWDQAFSTFIAIYTERFYKETSNLLQYTQQVKQMYRNGGAWRSYDETFRRHRAARMIPWNSTLMDKWLECSNHTAPSQPNRSVNVPNHNMRQQHNAGSQSFPAPRRRYYKAGLCFPFNNGETCRQNCKFQHSCDNCGGNHPFVDCRVPIRQNQGTSRGRQLQSHQQAPRQNYNARGRR
jgi:hypothetical protein